MVTLKALYTREGDCQLCLEMYPDFVGEECEQCEKLRTETVEVLDFVKDTFGASAIIKFKDGTLQMVPISNLKMQGDET